MAKKHHDAWIPILIIIAVLCISIALYYLPPEVFGTEWASTVAPLMWVFAPWLVILGAAICVLLWLVTKK